MNSEIPKPEKIKKENKAIEVERTLNLLTKREEFIRIHSKDDGSYEVIMNRGFEIPSDLIIPPNIKILTVQ